jgi:hypothetical protein
MAGTITDWVLFTKRTDDPKLAWLERRLDEARIPHRRAGWSWHAPILEVPSDRLDDAWKILTPVDDIEDDDPRFTEE